MVSTFLEIGGDGLNELVFDPEAFVQTLMAHDKLSKIDKLKLQQYMAASPDAGYVSVILASSLMNEETLGREMAKFVGGEFVTNSYKFTLAPDIYDIDIKAAVKEQILPILDESGLLVYLMTDPFNKQALESLNYWSSGKKFGINICTRALFQHVLESNSAVIAGAAGAADAAQTRDEIRLLLEKIIIDAIRSRASDIRMFRQSDTGLITFRIDGDLVKYKELDLLTLMRISEEIESPDLTSVSDTNKDVPRSGSMTLTVNDTTYELRVNFIPTKNGIDTNLRFLYKDNFDIMALGLGEDRLQVIQRFTDRDTGLVLFVGATGSGKSTTLYSLLDRVRYENTICTIEDPVEHRMDGVAQVTVTPQITFSKGIKSFLRHDPDIVVVGETRDTDTAKHLVMAADTGHLTFSTLHTKTATSAISRLKGLGIDGIEISDNLVAVVAQRLLKRVCVKCGRPMQLTKEDVYSRLGISCTEDADSMLVVKSEVGCEVCKKRGTLGRCLATEILLVDQEVRDMILQNVSIVEMEDRLRGRQLMTFEDDIVSHVVSGLVSIEEGMRVLAGVRQL